MWGLNFFIWANAVLTRTAEANTEDDLRENSIKMNWKFVFPSSWEGRNNLKKMRQILNWGESSLKCLAELIYTCYRSGCWQETRRQPGHSPLTWGVGCVLARETWGELEAISQKRENWSTYLFIQYLQSHVCGSEWYLASYRWTQMGKKLPKILFFHVFSPSSQ